MDVWEWVERRIDECHENGDHRLAELLYALPSAVVDEMHEAADAMIEEGLALSRERNDAWLEVFFRHWALQSRVLHRNDARKLGDAIAALEFAHRDECRGCPQAVCTVQDVASCYGLVDGPGYSEDRVAVCDEALAKITPSWSCFVCISNEKIDALLDRDRLEDAATFANAQRAAIVAQGDTDREALLNFEEILIRQGKYEEALEWSNRDQDDNDSESDRMNRRLRNGEIYAHLGRNTEAKESLVPLGELMQRPGQLIRWLRLAILLAERGILENTAALRIDIARAIAVLERNAISRIALLQSERLAYLCAVVRDRGGGERALATMQRVLPQLAVPLDAPTRVAAVSQLISGLPWPETDTESLSERLEHVELKEEAADLLMELEAAHRSELHHSRATYLLPLAEHLRRLGLTDESARVLRSGFLDAPSEELAYHMGNLWLHGDRHEELESFVQELATLEPTWAQAASRWFRARMAISARRYEEARHELTAMLPLVSPGHGARGLLAECERRLGNYAQALHWLDEILARGADPGPWDWERMVVATMLERWEVVRESALRVGMEAELGDGPEHGDGEFCQIVAGKNDYHWDAIRVGPVTARIIEIGPLSQDRRFGDLVVFDRLHGETVGEARTGSVDDAGNPETVKVYAYPWIATLRAGDWRRFSIDGVHPGDDVVTKLAAIVASFGGETQDVTERVMGGEYVVSTPEGEERKGVYLLAAIPSEVDVPSLHRALHEEAKSLSEPLVWLALLDDIGDEEAAAQQREAADEYGITG